MYVVLQAHYSIEKLGEQCRQDCWFVPGGCKHTMGGSRLYKFQSRIKRLAVYINWNIKERSHSEAKGDC